MMIQFTVPGKPQGKERPRHTKTGITYTPKKTREYEKVIRESYWSKEGNKRFDNDAMIGIEITAYYYIPKSFSKVKREQALNGYIRPEVKPDVDNILKVIADALNGVAYRDDVQIINAVVKKEYTEANPCVDVILWEAQPNEKF